MTTTPDSQRSGCPVHAAPAPQCPAGPDARKTRRPQDVLTPAYEVDRDAKGERWTIRSFALARTILRDAEATEQVGFGAELTRAGKRRRPVLHMDGAEHKEYRTAIARFFTPHTVGSDYRELMEGLSDKLIDEFRVRGETDLSALSMELAVAVAAQVVGLTNSSSPGMGKRLNDFFSGTPSTFSWRPDRFVGYVKMQGAVLNFLVKDVRPAIRARRKQPQEDVISYLLSKGYSDTEILIECISYGTAGMATTREFITMAAWHLLENEALRKRYLAAEEAERKVILHEILRLEPVLRRLTRRITKPLALNHEGETLNISEGATVSFEINAANVDVQAVGDAPLTLCPERTLVRGVQGGVLSFGDGHHRCPGAYLAIQESDIFLTRLLALPLRADGPPHLSYNELTTGYELEAFMIRIA